MANFGDNIQLRTMEAIPNLRADLKVQSFNLRGKGGGDDFAGKLAEMADKAKIQQSKQVASLRIDALGQDLGLLPTDPVARLVHQAKQRMAEEKFKEALSLLAKALKLGPGHHECLYLAAFCYVALTEHIKALRCLRPLHSAKLASGLATRVEVLKIDIRQHLYPKVMIESVLALQNRQWDDVTANLGKLVQLDPEVAMYHYMLAGIQMTADRMEEALKTLENGLQVCPPVEHQLLIGLHQQVQDQYVAKRMAPARKWFKKGDYARARTELQQLPNNFKQATLYVTFANYLGKLEGGGFLGFLMGGRKRAPKSVAPAGSYAEVEALYFFLVGGEIRQAKELLASDRPEQAEAQLKTALKFAPLFAFANYLYAGCIYRRLVQSLASDRPPDLTVILEHFQQALEAARTGATDPAIEDAPALLHVIESTLHQLADMEQQLKGRQEEAKLVNGVIAEFQAIMSSSEGGVRNTAHYNELHSRMKNLRNSLAGVRKEVHNPDAVQALGELSEAVERNWEQLAALKSSIAEGEVVERHFKTFQIKMEVAQSGGGIKSHSEFVAVRDSFRKLKRDVEADRRNLRSSDARQALDQLLDAVNKILSQLGD
jgi:tetratricopeptide (TPR) repeat protein